MTGYEPGQHVLVTEPAVVVAHGDEGFATVYRRGANVLVPSNALTPADPPEEPTGYVDPVALLREYAEWEARRKELAERLDDATPEERETQEEWAEDLAHSLAGAVRDLIRVPTPA